MLARRGNARQINSRTLLAFLISLRANNSNDGHSADALEPLVTVPLIARRSPSAALIAAGPAAPWPDASGLAPPLCMPWLMPVVELPE